MDFTKSSAKGKVHSNTSLPQETGEKSKSAWKQMKMKTQQPKTYGLHQKQC